MAYALSAAARAAAPGGRAGATGVPEVRPCRTRLRTALVLAVPQERARRLLLPGPQLLPLLREEEAPVGGVDARGRADARRTPPCGAHDPTPAASAVPPPPRALSELARAGAEAVKELLRHARGEADAPPRGSSHPHLHLIATDGGRDPDGSWHTPAEWDSGRLMRLFRERLLGSLLDRRAISQELVQKLLAWRHPGFSAHVGEPIAASDKQRLCDTAAYP